MLSYDHALMLSWHDEDTHSLDYTDHVSQGYMVGRVYRHHGYS
jgi:hypothetical protein